MKPACPDKCSALQPAESGGRSRERTVCRSPDLRQAERVRLATWNVNSVRARLPRLLDWLDGAKPDVVCLQETKISADAFPADEVAELGYATAAHGSNQWNGV